MDRGLLVLLALAYGSRIIGTTCIGIWIEDRVRGGKSAVEGGKGAVEGGKGGTLGAYSPGHIRYGPKVQQVCSSSL
jgi:hypothetical protein